MSITANFTHAEVMTGLGILLAVIVVVAASIVAGFLCDFLVEAIKTHHKD